MKRRILSFAMVLCLMLTLLCGSAGAEQYDYVALGDSIAAGYGLEGFGAVAGESGELVFTVPDGCFPSIIAGELGYKLANLAVSGDDTAALLERMETEQYSRSVKAAELITLTIGSNDILVPVMEKLAEKYMPVIMERLLQTEADEKTEQEIQSADSVQQLFEVIQGLNDYLCSDEMAQVLDAQVEQFKVNWNTIIDTLRAWNPDAVLIVTNYYNPYAMMNLNIGYIGLNLNIGNMAQRYLDQMNAYITENERNGELYTVADVTETSTNVKLDMAALSGAMFGAEVDLTNAINLDPHPDAAGHVYFAEQIKAALGVMPAIVFPDVQAGIWYEDPVSFVAGRGLIVGDEAGRFNPDAPMTLAQYMTVLYRYARAAAPTVIPEKATTGENWKEAAEYMNAILMDGCYENLSDNMSRYQMADITAAAMKLLETAGKTMNTRETHGFSDVTDNENVLFLESIYGIDGYAQKDGTYTFEGENSIKRAEVAKVLFNIITKSAA